MIYNVIIVNGVGKQEMKEGNYNVSVTQANGYDPTTLSPTTAVVNRSADTKTYTLTASGTLVFTFKEDSTTEPKITGGQIVMTNSTGTTQYGSPVIIGTDGTATFNNVPFSEESPIALYFKQLSSDGMHYPKDGVINVMMDRACKAVTVLNAPYAQQTIELKDATYSIPVAFSTMNFTETN